MGWELIVIMSLIFAGEIAGTIYFYIYYKKLDDIKTKLINYVDLKVKSIEEKVKKEKIIIIDDKMG